VVAVSGTGGWISVAAPVCSRPGHRGRLCYPILVHRRRTGERRSFCEDHSAEPIAAAPVPLTAPIILNWDSLNGHRSFALRGFCNVHHDWLTVLLRAWFAPATTCELVWDERLYPPKAILGTAYEFATGRRLASGDFEGGKSGAVRVLGKMGFRRPAPVTARVSGSSRHA
jgi:hypothetical protein